MRPARLFAGNSLYRRALRYEPLEPRRLLAVVTVDTLADTIDFNDGHTSLREAIFATNTVPGADTINFAPALTANGPATILLTQGELKITDALTIAGPGATRLVIDGNLSSRVFNITATSGDYAISGITITGGKTIGSNLLTSPPYLATTFNGGAIRSTTLGPLSVTDSVVTHSETDGEFARGGGVWAAGPLTLSGSQIVMNRTAGDRGYGGGVSANGLITITSSDISNNSAGGEGGFGGGVHAKNGIIASDSTINSNSALGGDATGGGVYVEGQLTAERMTVNGNKISGNVGWGGGIDVRGTIAISDTRDHQQQYACRQLGRWWNQCNKRRIISSNDGQ